MCGIAGYAGFSPGTVPDWVLNRMVDCMTHRGPDDRGVLHDRQLAIGMRRLAIIDIDQGHQPITTQDGCLSIVFNGEIYNYKEIKTSLEQQGIRFATNSDTETILQAYRHLGPDCLQLFRGMFAFAIADHTTQSLFLARDRLGVKPLYLAQIGNSLIFASEVKAILEHPAVSIDLNLESVDAYLSLRYVPGLQTMFQGIEKFPPGHYMHWQNGKAQVQSYWTVNASTEEISEDDAIAQFEQLLDESTRLRMLSERPVGAFLSGGLDSTAIVASLHKQFNAPINTYSVGFNWQGDELSIAAQTAKQLGCNHHEIICSPGDMGLLPKITWHLDEPIGDGIVLPMYLLARLASQTVTVVQSGEGADEILGGYFMHRVLHAASLYSRYTPQWMHKGLVRPVIQGLPSAFLNRFFDYPGTLGDAGKNRLLDFLQKLKTSSHEDQYLFLISLFSDGEKANLYQKPIHLTSNELASPMKPETADFNELLKLQFTHWLPDDILMKQDKITMAHSLEGRVPFMDHKLVEFAMSLPSRLKIRGKQNKWILRRYLANNYTTTFSKQPKVAFYIPIDQYLTQEPLKGMVETLLSPKSIQRRGLLNEQMVKQLLSTRADSSFLYTKQIFSLLALELWFRIFVDKEKGWA